MGDERYGMRALEIMDAINRVPRCTGDMERIHGFLMDYGHRKGWMLSTDAARNILMRVPASAGCEGAPVVVIQGHMDMVCDKGTESGHDFSRDPIVSWRDGDWLRARGTTLGADNAVALALAFDVAEDREVRHPALEILITTDEESGLVGAQKLEAGVLNGSVLLNIDSEDEGSFTVGCAGGMDMNLSFPLKGRALPRYYEAAKLFVKGFAGGHSGMEIGLGRANANVVLVRLLGCLVREVDDFYFGGLNGGSAHNAIARDARCFVGFRSDLRVKVEDVLERFSQGLHREYGDLESSFDLGLAELDERAFFMSRADGVSVLELLSFVPNGVLSICREGFSGVESSVNFAMMRGGETELRVLTNLRSASAERSREIQAMMRALSRWGGASCETGFGYPAWEPRANSDVLSRCCRIWKDMYGQEASVEVTHGGLECGAIGLRYPDMDMISFGPTIMQPHSPYERLNVPSLGRIRCFLARLLESYCGEGM